MFIDIKFNSVLIYYFNVFLHSRLNFFFILKLIKYGNFYNTNFFWSL